jgi:hypothetical protein
MGNVRGRGSAAAGADADGELGRNGHGRFISRTSRPGGSIPLGGVPRPVNAARTAAEPRPALLADAADGPPGRARFVRGGPGGCADFKGASVRVAWGRSGLRVRLVGSNAKGWATARSGAGRRAALRYGAM